MSPRPLLLLTLAALLAGCQNQTTNRAAAAMAPAPAPVAPVAAGQSPRVAAEQGPPVTVVHDAAALKQAIAALKGKVVVVNFWATWCPNCVEEFPDLVRATSERADKGVVLLTVSGDDEADLQAKVQPFLRKYGVREHAFLVAAQNEGQFIDQFQPGWDGNYPTTFLFDTSGKMARKLSDKQTYASLTKAIDEVCAAH